MKLLFASKQISMAGEDSATEQTFICADRQDTFPPQHTLTILWFTEMLVDCDFHLWIWQEALARLH